MKYFFLLSWFFVSPGFVNAQQQTNLSPGTKTLLESFQAKSGIVVVRGESEVGDLISNVGEGKVNVRCNELEEAGLGLKVSGLYVTVQRSGVFVDYDEIDSLIKGIDYLSKLFKEEGEGSNYTVKLVKPVTKLDSFLAKYVTRGGLVVSIFSGEKDSVGMIIETQEALRSRVVFKVNRLVEFRKLIQEGKAKLDAIRK